MKLEAVIFDMDGVLVDTETVTFDQFKKILNKNNYQIEKEFYLTLIGKNQKMISEILTNHYGANYPYDKISDELISQLNKLVDIKGVDVKKGVYELIDYLKDNNIKIAVATSSKRERAEKVLSKIEILDKINYVICGDEIINSKPDPEIFLKAANKLNVDSSTCIVIEDSDAGIQAAYKAGMLPIHVPDMKELDDENKHLPAFVKQDLLEVIEVIDNIIKNK